MTVKDIYITDYTIHNLKYQGRFWKGYLPDVLGLDWKYFNNGDLEYFDDINFMKGAIVYSDKVTTVSRSYAKEIQDPYFGEGLEGMLQKRDGDLSGIINGLDYEDYNPQTDKYIVKNFDVQNAIAVKGDNKEMLQKKLGLPVNRNIPMIGMVTRLVEAKGLDLVTRILDELLEYENVQFVLLGTGDRQYEDWFKGLVWRYPKKVSANIFFNNELAHQIYAASDLFLMPSQYEPCGIGQLIALRYGSVPIVRATGGLKDTVEAYNNYTQTGNGFSFNNYNAHELLFSIKRAIDSISDLSKRISLVENGMTADYSWEESAKQYKDLYASLKD